MLRKAVSLLSMLLAALALAGCGGADMFSPETRLFPRSVEIFKVQSWSGGAVAKPEMDSGRRTITPEDYVDANGQCAGVAQAAAPSDSAVATVAGDLGTTTVPASTPALPTVSGGIALGMTECEVTARAGSPAQVNIGSGEGAERKTVLTYMSGPWPGIYTFADGRLKEVERVAVPEPVKPAKPKPKSKSKPKTAARS